MIRHHIFACMWELAATIFCCPLLLRFADRHRRLAMPSRQTPTSCYRIPSEQEADELTRKSLAQTRSWIDFNKQVGNERKPAA